MKKIMSQSTVVALFTQFLFSSTLLAQEINRLEAINVFTEKSYLSSEEGGEQLDIKSIDETIASSVDDILKLSPGATTVGGPRSSAEGIQVRGLTSKKLYIYIDGAKQNFNADHANSAMLGLDPDNIKTVDIHKSSASFSQGGSLGGGIIFTTKDASDFLAPGEKWGSTYKVGYQQSNREHSQSIKTYGKSKNTETLLSLTKREAKEVLLGGKEFLPYSSYEDTNVLAKFSVKLSKTESLKFTTEHFSRKDNSPLNPTFSPPVEMSELNGEAKIDRSSYNVEYKTNPKRNRFLNIRSVLYSNTHKVVKTRESDKRLDIRKVETNGGSLSNRIDLARLNKKPVILDLGLEHIKDKLTGVREGERLAVYPGGESQEQGVFAQFEISPLEGLTISPGIRYQTYKLNSEIAGHESKRDSSLSKKLTSRVEATDWFEFYANYSEGFNGPKVQDVYIDGLHSQGDDFFIADNFFIPNYDLVPETSRTLDVGIKIERSLFSKDDLVSVKLNQYWTEAKDYIYYEKIDYAIFDEKPGTTQFINIPDVKISGQEIEVEYLYDRFEAKATFTRVRGRNVTKGIHLSDMPADQYTFNFKYNLEDIGLSFGYLGILTNDQDRVNPQTIERTDATPGYYTHNIFATKSFESGDFKGFEISTRIDNLTNRVYRKHASNLKEVGMDYKLAVKYKINIL